MDPATMAVVGGTIASNLFSNFTADRKAANQYARESALMKKQFQMNRQNALETPRLQKEGLRLAGLNPALAQDLGATQVSPVSKGSASMAENVELSPSDLLTAAQYKNIEADTAKKEAEAAKISGVDTKNTEADTFLKQAQTLFTGANTEKVNEEAQNMQNINEQYADQKKGVALFGQTAAQDWQKQPWYKSMTSGQRQVIDAIAQGQVDLTPGTLSALSNSIKASNEMSENQKNLAVDSLARTVVEKQLSNPDVVDAMVKDVQAKYNLTQKQIDNLKANTEKTLYKMKELIDLDLQGKKYSNQISKEEAQMKNILKKAEKQGNMDYLRNEGDYGNYAWKVLENAISRTFDLAMMLLAGRYVGKTAGKAASEASPIQKPTGSDVEHFGNTGLTPSHIVPSTNGSVNVFEGEGIQQMRRNRR